MANNGDRPAPPGETAKTTARIRLHPDHPHLMPGHANGGNRFDLSRWDGAYFARLRDVVDTAARHGIVVEVTLDWQRHVVDVIRRAEAGGEGHVISLKVANGGTLSLQTPPFEEDLALRLLAVAAGPQHTGSVDPRRSGSADARHTVDVDAGHTPRGKEQP